MALKEVIVALPIGSVRNVAEDPKVRDKIIQCVVDRVLDVTLTWGDCRTFNVGAFDSEDFVLKITRLAREHGEIYVWSPECDLTVEFNEEGIVIPRGRPRDVSKLPRLLQVRRS